MPPTVRSQALAAVLAAVLAVSPLLAGCSAQEGPTPDRPAGPTPSSTPSTRSSTQIASAHADPTPRPGHPRPRR